MKLITNKFKHSERFDLQRKVVSHITTTSWQEIPHVSYIYEPDITDFYNEFKILVGEEYLLKSPPTGVRIINYFNMEKNRGSNILSYLL